MMPVVVINHLFPSDEHAQPLTKMQLLVQNLEARRPKHYVPLPLSTPTIANSKDGKSVELKDVEKVVNGKVNFAILEKPPAMIGEIDPRLLIRLGDAKFNGFIWGILNKGAFRFTFLGDLTYFELADYEKVLTKGQLAMLLAFLERFRMPSLGRKHNWRPSNALALSYKTFPKNKPIKESLEDLNIFI